MAMLEAKLQERDETQKLHRNSVAVPQRESMMRMNFLYQSAWVLVSQNQVQLSQFYIRTMKSISQKLVIKLDPSIKRTICKSCDTLLVPGITSIHRIRVRPQRHVVVRCLICGTYKKFFTRDYDGSPVIAGNPLALVEAAPCGNT